MWDRTLIESKGFSRGSKRWWTIPVAAVFHVALILIAILASYWHVEAIEAPLAKMKYISAIPVNIGPPPAPGGGGRPRAQETSRRIETPEVTQPTEIAPLSKEPDVSLEEFGPGIDPAAPSGPGTPEGIDGGDSTAFGSGSYKSQPAETDRPIILYAGIVEPALIARVEPEYPRAALIARAQGMVILEAVITKTGTVEQIKTLRADNPFLEKAAIDAVLKWRYRPAILNGKPVKVYFTVTVIFKLK